MSLHHHKLAVAILEAPFFALLVCSVFFLLGKCAGQAACSAEVKLLLAPRDAQAVATSIQAGTPIAGHVYLYDTEARDLLMRGIILRVRQAPTSADITVKLRTSSKQAIADAASHHQRFKCEVDQSGDTASYSYSAQVKLKAEVPATGMELQQLLSESQRQLLMQAGSAVDWSKVKQVAEIQSTGWTATSQPPLGKLDLELWVWPGGSVLELSTKTELETMQAAYDRLKRFAVGKGLALDTTQQFKTTLALQSASP